MMWTTLEPPDRSATTGLPVWPATDSKPSRVPLLPTTCGKEASATSGQELELKMVGIAADSRVSSWGSPQHNHQVGGIPDPIGSDIVLVPSLPGTLYRFSFFASPNPP